MTTFDLGMETIESFSASVLAAAGYES